MTSFLRRSTLVFFLSLLISNAYAANLGLVTWYEQTGGLKGALNHVGDQVSGVNICPAANTNANTVPGCDMDDDPGFHDNGTPQDGSDDYYTGDLIVRTNDAFLAVANYNVNGSSEEVTITGSAPQGLVFDALPGFCQLPQSSLSSDGRTVTCYLGEKTPGTSQALAFPVRVLGGNANGTQPGPVGFTVSGPNSTEVSDDTDTSIIVTAAPRWNLRKSLYTINAYTKTASDATAAYPEGTKGWRVYYKYYLEVWDDTQPASVDALLGNESLGDDATVTFTDKISDLYQPAPAGSTGAELMWCRSDLSNSSDPYNNLSQDPSHPERSLSDSGSVSCSQAAAGADISVTVSGADLTLDHIPTRSRSGGALPANRKMGAIGVVTVFVPVADAEAAGGDLPTKNCITGFDPDSVSGVSNFGSETENEDDNCYARTLHVNDGSWWKIYRGKADPVDWGLPGEGQGQASDWRAGDGWVSPGEEFASYQSYSNVGGAEATGVVLCDVMDAATYDVVDLNGQTGNAVYLHQNGGYDLNRLRVEYATGYVASTWPPAPPTGQAVVDECSDPGVQWYTTTSDALAAGGGRPITKVRITALDPVQPGQTIYFFVKNRARSTYADTGALPAGAVAGEPIPNGKVMPNFATYKDDGERGGHWLVGSYDPKTSMNDPHSGSPGDRLGLTRALARISKETGNDDGINSVGLGQQFEYVLKPVFTTNAPAGAAVDDQVTVTDVLPPGLAYVAGSAVQGGAPFEPVVTDCTGAATPDPSCTQAGETVLFWDLGTRTPNEDIDPIVFKAEVGFENADGTVLNNTAFVDSPSDASPQAVRTANRSVVVSVPRELIISKSVDRTRREVKDVGPYTWRINLKNATPNPLTHPDVIDVLPYNGDTGNPLGENSLPRNPPSSFHGLLQFVAVSLSDYGGNGPCGTGGNGETYYFSNANPASINLDPKHDSNALGPGGIWCQGSASGPAATCGFGPAQVTAVRVHSNNTMPDGAACRIELQTQPAADNAQWNLEDDVYTNSAGASADELSLPVGSNSVSVTVYASSIGDLAWEDRNGDGVQDAGEPGLAGVAVHLLDGQGQPVDDPAHPGTPYVVNTDANGHYVFGNLPQGDYQVRFETPANHGVTARDQGGDDAADSDADPAGGIVSVSLPADTHATNYDAGFYPYHSIGDTVFHDQNNNGQPDPGEGMGGVTVTLTPPADVDLGNGPGQPVTTTTDGQGNYLFENLPAGAYTVTVDETTLPIAQLQGHNTVDPDGGNDSTAQVMLTRGADNLDQDFGYYLHAADLSLSKTVDNPQPAVGSQVTFTVTLHNDGPLQASGVAVTDALPAGYRFVAASPAQGQYNAATGVWDVGTLDQGADATLTLTVRVVASADAGAYENWAEVSASDLPDIDSVPGVGNDHGHGQDDGLDGDPNPVDDDEASASTQPVPTVDLSTQKTIEPPNAHIGDTVTFNITVANAQFFSNATGVAVTDKLPSGYSFQSVSASQGNYDAASGVWDVGNLAAGRQATLAITAMVLGHGEYTNWAEVSASNLPDIDSVPGVGNDHGHGQDDGLDGDPNPVDDDEASATLGRKLRVHGTIYHDRDVNQAMDGGDPAINPAADLNHPLYVKVYLDGDGDCSTTADFDYKESAQVQPDGTYTFDNASPDSKYCFVLSDNGDGAYITPWSASADGWLHVNPDSSFLPVTVRNDDVFDQDFGIFHGSKVSGSVFYDDGRGPGSNANNALQDGNEPGVPGTLVTISDGNHSRSTTTDSNGHYTLYLPADWGDTTLSHSAGPGTGYNDDGVGAAYVASGPNDPAATVTHLDPSQLAGGGSTTNFGVAHHGSFIPNQNGQTFPGGTVVYHHVYTPGSEGNLSFERSSGDWSYRIRVDLNGDGDFDDPGEGFRNIEPGSAADYAVDDSWPRNPDGSLSGVPVDVEVTAPADAYDGQVDIAPIQSSLTWQNNANVVDEWSVTDVTTVSAKGYAKLSKRVRNVTAGEDFDNSNEASPGDVLEYCIDYSNPSDNEILGATIHDPIPQQVQYVVGSLRLNGAPLSDASDNDAGEVVNEHVSVRLGNLAPLATGSVCFRVEIPSP